MTFVIPFCELIHYRIWTEPVKIRLKMYGTKFVQEVIDAQRR